LIYFPHAMLITYVSSIPYSILLGAKQFGLVRLNSS